MPEILTESFCERCGTRYTFESAAPRAARLKGVKVLSRGFKNFVLSDDTSMDEAMAAARSETDREITSQQLDAFHKTFNFCMSCRQYTCANCWNEADGQCLTCSPHLGHEVMPAPFPDLDPTAGIALHGERAEANGHAIADTSATLAWPTMDLEREPEVTEATVEAAVEDDLEPIDASARLAALGALDLIEPEAVAEPQALAEPEAEPELATELEPVVEAAAEPDIEPVAAVDLVEAEAEHESVIADAEPVETETAPDSGERAAAAATSNTSDLLRRFRPGQSLDAELEAFERARAADVSAAQPAEPAEQAAQAEPIESVESAAASADAPETAPVDEPPAEPRIDVVAQPTWQIVAPEPEAPSGPDAGPAVPDAQAPEPQWPAQPEWPSQRPAAGLPFLGRPAQPTGSLESLWAESAREVTSTPTQPPLGTARPVGGVQPCVSCGLSLSATARFCRRCGSAQG